MGLDSVYLVVNFENYFGISIPDVEAEKIATVGDAVKCVAAHLSVSNDDQQLKNDVLQKLNAALKETGIINTSLNYSDTIFNVLNPEDSGTWHNISSHLQLKLPLPSIPKQRKINWPDALRWLPRYNWKTLTTEQFVTAICAENYDKLLVKGKVNNTFEILVAVTAITVDSLGVDVYEVEPGKSFTNDLGVD